MVGQYTVYNLLFVDQSSSGRLEKFVEDIPTSPEVIGAYTLDFRPKFKLSRLKLFGGPRPIGAYAART